MKVLDLGELPLVQRSVLRRLMLQNTRNVAQTVKFRLDPACEQLGKQIALQRSNPNLVRSRLSQT